MILAVKTSFKSSVMPRRIGASFLLLGGVCAVASPMLIWVRLGERELPGYDSIFGPSFIGPASIPGFLGLGVITVGAAIVALFGASKLSRIAATLIASITSLLVALVSGIYLFSLASPPYSVEFPWEDGIMTIGGGPSPMGPGIFLGLYWSALGLIGGVLLLLKSRDERGPRRPRVANVP